ncbi:MFS transporter [Parafrankia colletiae]|uniref:MFS transporter n=1 Tax=Parafrankia colletiae TaxID=573497 RepID=A0A1S1QNX2_9ACTN|nr:MFS transporter [Parafrankia colletiae]MCK9904518.1 MFS transporter [Frankia sp. Cpl3]OHV35407.1 MFS transporter [Parafrankia colletiae]
MPPKQEPASPAVSAVPAVAAEGAEAAVGDGPSVSGSMAVLVMAATAFSIAQTTVVPGVGALTEALHTTPANVSWVFSAYLIAAAILTPIMGRLGDMFGRRRLLIVALLLFAVGSVAAALAGSIWLVVAARVLQASGGGIFPLCFGIIRETFPERRQPGAIGLIAAIAGIGAGAGLLVGGLLLDHASWRWIFWIGAIMSGAAAVGALRLRESGTRTPGRIDLPGALLLAVGLTTPLVALTQTSSWGWGSPRTLGLMAAGLAILVCFGLFERRVAEPLVDMRVLGRPVILATNFATLLAGSCMFGAFVLVPQIAQAPESVGYGFGLDATGAGLLLLPASVAMLLIGANAGRVSLRLGARKPLMGGFLFAAAGLALLATNHGSEGVVIATTCVVFIGIGLSMSVVPNIIVVSAPADATGQATGVNALVRSVGAALGSQVVATLLAASETADHPLPTDGAFTRAFWLATGAATCAALAAVLIPRHRPAPNVDVTSVPPADSGADPAAAATMGQPRADRPA